MAFALQGHRKNSDLSECGAILRMGGDRITTHAKPREFVLPPSLPPRGLRREKAAAYIGVSASKFDEMVV